MGIYMHNEINETLTRLELVDPTVFLTYKIVEATDTSEYAALSSANKDIYKMIISCGTVKLGEGTKIREYLASMFGLGTTTRTNLLELIGE